MDDEEDDEAEGDAALEEGEAEYAFEGFRVEVNARIALVPPGAREG